VKRLHDLDAYVTGELDGPAADALEEALFDAPDDPDLAFVDQLTRLGATLAAHGTFDMGVTRAQIDELIAAGHKVQILDAGEPSTTSRTLVMARDVDLIVTKLALGRRDLERVDVELTVVEHQVTKVIKDAFVDQTTGTLWGLCERPLAQLAFGAGGTTIVRARHRDGDRAVIAEWHLLGQLG
jgi:hypothetical protein